MLSLCTAYQLLASLPRHLDVVGRPGVGWDGHQWGKTAWSGVWFFLGCLARIRGCWLCWSTPSCTWYLSNAGVLSAFLAAGDWVKKGSYHTAWSLPPLSSCPCSCSFWQGKTIGPQTGGLCWSLLCGLWRAITPLMKPWCAEGVVPTVANLNLCRIWFLLPRQSFIHCVSSADLFRLEGPLSVLFNDAIALYHCLKKCVTAHQNHTEFHSVSSVVAERRGWERVALR